MLIKILNKLRELEVYDRRRDFMLKVIGLCLENIPLDGMDYDTKIAQEWFTGVRVYKLSVQKWHRQRYLKKITLSGYFPNSALNDMSDMYDYDPPIIEDTPSEVLLKGLKKVVRKIMYAKVLEDLESGRIWYHEFESADGVHYRLGLGEQERERR